MGFPAGFQNTGVIITNVLMSYLSTLVSRLRILSLGMVSTTRTSRAGSHGAFLTTKLGI